MSYINDRVINLAAAATNAGKSICLLEDNCPNVSFVISYGAIVGVIKVWISNDLRARANHPDYASAVWYDATSEYTLFTDPAGVAGTIYIGLSDVGVGFIRLAYTHTSGTGVLYAWISAHD